MNIAFEERLRKPSLAPRTAGRQPRSSTPSTAPSPQVRRSAQSHRTTCSRQSSKRSPAARSSEAVGHARRSTMLVSASQPSDQTRSAPSPTTTQAERHPTPEPFGPLRPRTANTGRARPRSTAAGSWASDRSRHTASSHRHPPPATSTVFSTQSSGTERSRTATNRRRHPTARAAPPAPTRNARPPAPPAPDQQTQANRASC